MTRSLGPELPPPLLNLLSGQQLEHKIGLAIQCLTNTEDEWPYVALVSVGELLTVGPGRLRLAIWASSTTSRNLDRSGRGALALVLESASYVVRYRAAPRGALEIPDSPPLRVFELEVCDVLEDVAPYATLTSGISYELHDPAGVLKRWEKTLQALRDW